MQINACAYIYICMWQISLHPVLDKTTYHLINPERLAIMKKVPASLPLLISSLGPLDTVVLCSGYTNNLNIKIQEAVLVNASRGPVIDEVALVEHLKANPMFRVGLDVFEDEPYMKPGLADMKNAVVVPHIASASKVHYLPAASAYIYIYA